MLIHCAPQCCMYITHKIQNPDQLPSNISNLRSSVTFHPPPGAPCLPPGGLSSLHPRLTVVRKHTQKSGHDSSNSTPLNSYKEQSVLAGAVSPADRELPSVMTCANYIKLPAYSSKQVLKERLIYAMTEGQGSFDLT